MLEPVQILLIVMLVIFIVLSTNLTQEYNLELFADAGTGFPQIGHVYRVSRKLCNVEKK